MKKGFLKTALLVAMLATGLAPAVQSKAEVIINTTGEKTPDGEDFVAKRWTGWYWNYNYDYQLYGQRLADLTPITYEVEYLYEKAYAMEKLINAERRKAGVSELEAKDVIEDQAMYRAAEAALFCWHGRPSGVPYSYRSMFCDRENLCVEGANDTAAKAIEGQIASSGHYKTMIDPQYSYMGVGCVRVNGYTYWIMTFTIDENDYEEGCYYGEGDPRNVPIVYSELEHTKRDSYLEDFTASVCVPYLVEREDAKLELNSLFDGEYYYNDASGKDVANRAAYKLQVGESKSLVGCATTNYDWLCTIPLTADQVTVESLNPDVAVYSKGKVKGVSAGTATFKITLKADSRLSTKCKIKVTEPSSSSDSNSNSTTSSITNIKTTKKIRSGLVVKTKKAKYQIISKKKRLVAYKKHLKGSVVTVPAVIKINGVRYKVTKVASNAFRNKKVVGVSLGSNITEIGSNAFRNCTKMRECQITSMKLKKIGSHAFYNALDWCYYDIPLMRSVKYYKMIEKAKK